MFGRNEIVPPRYFKNGKAIGKLLVTSMFVTLQGEGPFAGRPAFFVRLAKCNLACSFCFVPSTKVRMADGTKQAIKDVRVGDQVMSWNGEDFEPRTVTKLYRSVAKRLIKVDVANRVTWCTPEHPFLTSKRGWVHAEDLQPGDILVHWSVHDRMTMFNPATRGRSNMSVESREAAADRMARLWDRPGFRNQHLNRMRNDNPMHDPEVAERVYLSREAREKSPLEMQIQKICEGLPIFYCGDGRFPVAHKFPDFKVRGQNKLIEVWASDSLWARQSGRDDNWINERRALFARQGYETLFLPIAAGDLRLANRPAIRERVAKFIHNGAVVKSVTEVTENRAWARLYGTRKAPRLVYNLEIEGTHTYTANDMVVHNCDTYFDSGDWFTLPELDAAIDKRIQDHFHKQGYSLPDWAFGARWKARDMVLVITGGEPMLQPNLVPFLEGERFKFAETQIESNGLLVLPIPDSTTLVVSPKCKEEDGKAVEYLKPNPRMLARADCMKFVMSADESSPYSSIPQWAIEWKCNTGKAIYISPMNIYNREPEKAKQMRAQKSDITIDERSTVDEVISFWEPGLLDMERNRMNHEYAARYCVNHGLFLSIQMHLFASVA